MTLIGAKTMCRRMTR